MDDSKFILCRNCGAIHHVTSFDKEPSYSLVAGGAKTGLADDWRDFVAHHAGHRLEALNVLGEYHYSTGSAGDPMAVAYLKVTDGQREFLIRRCRRSIDEPLRFEPIAGRLEELVTALEIQEREIRKELKLRFRWGAGRALSDAKIDLFVTLFREAIASIDPRSIAKREPSCDHDNFHYVELTAPVKDALMKKYAMHFTADELEGLRKFVDANSDGMGVMTLELRRQVSIEIAG